MSDSDRQRRIRQLEQEIRSLGASFQVDDGFDERMTESFLESVLEFERSPMTTLRQQLAESGYGLPSEEPPSITRELWTLIRQLAFIGVYVENTDHLDDRELYHWLVQQIDEPTRFPQSVGFAMHLDVIGSGSDDDNRLYLTYYASDEDRATWQSEFPSEELPEHGVPPHDRDRYLPKPDDVAPVA